MVKHIRKKLLGRTGYGLLMVMGSLSHVVRGSQGTDVLKQGMIPPITSRVIKRVNRWEPSPKKKTSNNPNGDARRLPIVRSGNPKSAESVDNPFAELVGDLHFEPLPPPSAIFRKKPSNNSGGNGQRLRVQAGNPNLAESVDNPFAELMGDPHLKPPLVIPAIDPYLESLPMTPEMAMERIPNDPNGDTWYLYAVRTGNLRLVELFLGNPHLNLDAVDGNGNTDLMLAIMGEGQMNYGLNRQTIFYLIFRFRNRNWNLRNRWGQTALFLAAYLMRFECVEALFHIDGVDPNIPDGRGITPLVAAIINVFESNDSKANMVLRFVHHPRVNVNQRGADGKLPLQVAFEMRLVKQPHPEQKPSLCILFDAFCRRSLTDYDLALKNVIIPGLVQQLRRLEFERQRQLRPLEREYGQLTSGQSESEYGPLDFPGAEQPLDLSELDGPFDLRLHDWSEYGQLRPLEPQQQPVRPEYGPMALRLQQLSVDAQFNVGDYHQCSLDELVNAIQLKIRSILSDFRTETDDSLRDFIEQLSIIRANAKLFHDFLMQQDRKSRIRLFARLQ